MECSLPGSSVRGILQARILEWAAHGSSQPREGIQVSRIAGGFFFNIWATKEPKNTGVGSLYLFWWIFPTQELKPGLLPCRRILYQLSYQGSPFIGTQPHPFTVCDCFWATTRLSWQSWIVAKESEWLQKQIFAMWSFTGKVCWLLVWMLYKALWCDRPLVPPF